MIIWQIIAVLLVITAIVAVHELGHFLFAKWKKMDVEEFCILGLPFGKKFVLGTTKAGMKITTHPFFPLGGFVRVKGMEPKPDGSEVYIERGFYSRGVGARAWVLFAGPLFSVLFGYVLFAGGYMMFGRPEASNEPVIGNVQDESPAKKAGLQPGDRVIRIDGKPVPTFYDMRLAVRESPEKEMNFVIERNGQQISLTVVPELRKGATISGPDGRPIYEGGLPKTADVGYIGAGPVTMMRAVSLGESLALSWETSWTIIAGTARILTKPKELSENVGGPIAIFSITGSTAAKDPGTLIFIAALLSLSIGLINLLPIPLFDGGQLVVCAIEAFRGGRRLPFKVQERVAAIGVAIVLMLFLSVMFLDISRLFKGNSSLVPFTAPTRELVR